MLALTITADDRAKVYGAADPTLAYSVTGLVNGDAKSVVGGVRLSTATGAAASAGTHPITVSGGTAANYAITDVEGTLTVAKAPLTVAADNATVTSPGSAARAASGEAPRRAATRVATATSTAARSGIRGPRARSGRVAITRPW